MIWMELKIFRDRNIFSLYLSIKKNHSIEKKITIL